MSYFSSSSFSGYQRALDHVGEEPGYVARALAVKVDKLWDFHSSQGLSPQLTGLG